MYIYTIYILMSNFILFAFVGFTVNIHTLMNESGGMWCCLKYKHFTFGGHLPKQFV